MLSRKLFRDAVTPGFIAVIMLSHERKVVPREEIRAGDDFPRTPARIRHRRKIAARYQNLPENTCETIVRCSVLRQCNFLSR